MESSIYNLYVYILFESSRRHILWFILIKIKCSFKAETNERTTWERLRGRGWLGEFLFKIFINKPEREALMNENGWMKGCMRGGLFFDTRLFD